MYLLLLRFLLGSQLKKMSLAQRLVVRLGFLGLLHASGRVMKMGYAGLGFRVTLIPKGPRTQIIGF